MGEFLRWALENHLILNIWYLWLHTGHWIPDWVITGCQQIIWLPPYTDFCTARLFCIRQFLHVCVLAHKTDIVLSQITLLSTVFYRFCPFSFMFAHLHLPQCIRKSSVLELEGFPYLGWSSLERGFLMSAPHNWHLSYCFRLHTTNQPVAQPWVLFRNTGLFNL